MRAAFPEAQAERIDPEAEEQMDILMEIIVAIRNIRGEMNVSPAAQSGGRVPVRARFANQSFSTSMSALSCDLAKVSTLRVARTGEMEKPKYAAGTVVGNVEVFVVLKDILDFESESKRLQKELAKLEKEFGLTQRKLSNEDFLQKAPPEVIEKEREKGARLGEKIDEIEPPPRHYERLDE